ncbi:hypothetical protein BGZ81_006753 [Podila clonocystis]|nr:hypothetical protein BGZ81_006753 [Podila clonocystis]
MAQGHHNNTSLHHSHDARDQPHQRRTSNNGSSNSKYPQRPRSRHNSGHSSSQRDRSHSNSSNTNVHVGDTMPHYASKFSASNIVITNVLPSSGINCNGTSGIVGSSPTISSSTTTTFYSGVKLAPPVQSASIEELERRPSDQKVWYTIQVFPCHLVIPGGNGGTIPRKPYRIYRRYEDVADFADQLEEEFPALIPKITSSGAPPCSFAMEGPAQELSRSISGSSVICGASVSPTPWYLTSAAMVNNHNASTHHPEN